MAKDLKDYTQKELIEYINELKKQLKSEKYGLYWDKSIEKEKVVENCLTKIPVLEREREQSSIAMVKITY